MIARCAVAVLVVLGGGSAHATDRQSLESAALLRVDTAISEESHDVQMAEATVDLEFDAAVTTNWSFSMAARIGGDTQDLLEPGQPDQRERSSYNRRWLLSDTADAELREFFVDGQLGPVFLRVGKQQTVWGQADGLRVLDVVNPFSFREFIWPEPQERRIALWTLKAEVPVGPATLQLLWLPDPTYDEIPTGEATFAITTPLLIPNVEGLTQIKPTQRPSGLLDSSDVGARLSAFVGGWDVTFNYLYHYYDDPVPVVMPLDAGVALAPRYERSRLAGMTFSNAFGNTTVRGEIGHSTDRWFLTNESSDMDRVFESDELAYVVALDNTAFANTLLSVQYFESSVRNPAPLMTRSRTERQATLLMQRTFRNESVKCRALWLTSLNRGDGGVQARVSWQTSANLALGVSVERFYGNPLGLFGEFADASRVAIDFQWSWQQAH